MSKIIATVPDGEMCKGCQLAKKYHDKFYNADAWTCPFRKMWRKVILRTQKARKTKACLAAHYRE